MKYGKIEIDEGIILFSSHMITTYIPIEDLIWAYHRRGSAFDHDTDKTLVSNYLVVVNSRGRRFEFSMTEREAVECLQELKSINHNIALGFPAGNRILLQNLPNTRDLGAIETEDGRFLFPGRLLRSGELYHISSSDIQVLREEYHLTTIIDLRSSAERRNRPDDVLEGVNYYPCPLLDEDSRGFFDELSIMEQIGSLDGDPKGFIKSRYERIIKDPYSIGQLARVIEYIRKNEDGAILWHSNLGKDRTSIVTAILLHILGVPREAILKDYLKSNISLAMEKEYALELMVSNGFERENVKEKVSALFEGQEEYLQAVFDAIEYEYGSVTRFLKRGLYLTPKAIEDLKNRYLI